MNLLNNDNFDDYFMTSHFLDTQTVSKITYSLNRYFFWISEVKWHTYDQVWWPILGICALHLSHPKCTHTAVNTHTHREHTPGAVGSHLCCGARGAVGGSVPCSRAPQSWYWRWRERCTFTPPTYNSCRPETPTRNQVISNYLQPFYVLWLLWIQTCYSFHTPFFADYVVGKYGILDAASNCMYHLSPFEAYRSMVATSWSFCFVSVIITSR